MLVPSIFRSNKNELEPFGFDFFDPDFFESGLPSPFQSFTDFDKKLRGNNEGGLMATDITETDEGYELEINIPGFKKEEITLELKDGYLMVSAHKEVSNKEVSNKEETKGKLIRQERYISGVRRFVVSDNITEEDIKAKFENGVLTLNIPKKEEKPEEPKHVIAIEG